MRCCKLWYAPEVVEDRKCDSELIQTIPLRLLFQVFIKNSLKNTNGDSYTKFCTIIAFT